MEVRNKDDGLNNKKSDLKKKKENIEKETKSGRKEVEEIQDKSKKKKNNENKSENGTDKKGTDIPQRINNVTVNSEEKLKPKKKIFALTTYDDIKSEINEKKLSEISKNKAKSENTLVLGEKIVRPKKQITSKHILKMLLKSDIPSLNEEVLVILLKISKVGLSKQGMVCRELINAIKLIMSSTDDGESYYLTDKNRRLVSRLLNVVNQLTYVLGGLDNTCSYIKKLIQKIPKNMSMIDIKEILKSKLDEFINTKINTKDIISTKHGSNLIKENDCILIYGKSQIYRNILSRAVNRGINFKVIYVDNRENNHIKTEIEFLSKLGVSVVYSYLNGISGLIDKVTKVFIKAKSMLSNGNLLGAVGSSLIACIANNFKKPVIVFCETYKFWDKIMMNSFQISNIQTELDTTFNFNSMRMLYDITPANYINMVVCEHGYIPPTSVPVVIREFGQEEVEFE